MDKITKRAAQVTRQFARRKARQKKTEQWEATREARQGAIRYAQDYAELKKTARKQLHEDWALGPLAPRRNIDTTGAHIHGLLPQPSLIGSGLTVPEAHRTWMPFAAGDRVVVVKGPQQGRIAKITDVHEDTQRVRLEGVRSFETFQPRWMRELQEQGVAGPTSRQPALVPLDEIRLVVPLIDNETGTVTEKIVERVEQHKVGNKIERIIPGLNLVLPFPETREPEHKSHPDDTLRITVDTETYVPALRSPPFPGEVIDELRNKYSKRRIRHDPEFVEKLEAITEAEQQKLESVKEMDTPLMALRRKLKEDAVTQSSDEARRARGELVGDDLLARIGQLMSESRGQTVKETPGVKTASIPPQSFKSPLSAARSTM